MFNDQERLNILKSFEPKSRGYQKVSFEHVLNILLNSCKTGNADCLFLDEQKKYLSNFKPEKGEFVLSIKHEMPFHDWSPSRRRLFLDGVIAAKIAKPISWGESHKNLTPAHGGVLKPSSIAVYKFCDFMTDEEKNEPILTEFRPLMHKRGAKNAHGDDMIHLNELPARIPPEFILISKKYDICILEAKSCYSRFLKHWRKNTTANLTQTKEIWAGRFEQYIKRYVIDFRHYYVKNEPAADVKALPKSPEGDFSVELKKGIKKKQLAKSWEKFKEFFKNQQKGLQDLIKLWRCWWSREWPDRAKNREPHILADSAPVSVEMEKRIEKSSFHSDILNDSAARSSKKTVNVSQILEDFKARVASKLTLIDKALCRHDAAELFFNAVAEYPLEVQEKAAAQALREQHYKITPGKFGYFCKRIMAEGKKAAAPAGAPAGAPVKPAAPISKAKAVQERGERPAHVMEWFALLAACGGMARACERLPETTGCKPSDCGGGRLRLIARDLPHALAARSELAAWSAQNGVTPPEVGLSEPWQNLPNGYLTGSPSEAENPRFFIA
jgi:hypothetical protein